MKALKEKRLSLRSYLRRGLVILSLFALAFAFASCGGSESGGPDNPGGGDIWITTTVVSGPKVTYIRIKTQPTEDSYQGMPPNISGVEIEAIVDDVLTPFNAQELVEFGFTPSGYCDIPGSGTAAGTFFITYGSVSSDRLIIPGVIALQSVKAEGTADVFSDEWPAIGKEITLKYHYEWDTDNPYAVSVPASIAPGNFGTHDETFNPIKWVYPPIGMDASDPDDIKAVAVIGSGFAHKDGYKAWTLSNITTPTGVNKKTADIGVNYYQVSSIRGAIEGDDYFAYDDDTEKYASKDLGENRKNIHEDLMPGAKFEVYYWDKDNKGYPKNPKTFGWDKFLENVEYALKSSGVTFDEYDQLLAKTIFQTDGLYVNTSNNTNKRKGDTVDTLNWNEDEGPAVWKVGLKYVPEEYGRGGYSSVLYVDVPVYTFEGTIAVKQNPAAPEYFLQKWEPSPVAFPAYLETALNARWTLSGTYERSGRENKTRDLKEVSDGLRGISTAWFYAGISGEKNAAGIKVEGQNINLLGDGAFSRSVGQLTGTMTGGRVMREWGLPLKFRTSAKLTGDETVLINLYYDKR